MSQGRYTISEIDRMRVAITYIVPFWCGDDAHAHRAVAEDRLRTYMANGTTPEELEDVARGLKTDRDARIAEYRERLGL